MDALQIAKVAHAACRAYCVVVWDSETPHWNDEISFQRQSLIEHVEYLIAHPEAAVETRHTEIMAKAGQNRSGAEWYALYPESYRAKLAITHAMVRACAALPTAETPES